MPNIAHFAIHADDLDRARRFYEQVFGWKFQPWGPPDFFMISTGTAEDPGIHGSLQRRAQAVEDRGMIGYECTIAVSSVSDTAASVEANGGEILCPEMVIANVGRLIQFTDPEGNVVSAMHFDENAV